MKPRGLAALAIFLCVLDQLAKQYSITAFHNKAPLYLFGDYIYLTSSKNSGAAFSMLQGETTLLITAGIMLVLLMSFWLLSSKKDRPVMNIGMSILLGGSIGNLVDRIFRGHVIDFIGVKCFSVLNSADIMINIGIGLIILDLIFHSAMKKDRP